MLGSYYPNEDLVLLTEAEGNQQVMMATSMKQAQACMASEQAAKMQAPLCKTRQEFELTSLVRR